jgi:hypothetical protein
MPGKSDVAKLSKCIRDSHGNAAQRKACEDAFVADGGTVQEVTEGGKIFMDPNGGKIFVTNGGKIF